MILSALVFVFYFQFVFADTISDITAGITHGRLSVSNSLAGHWLKQEMTRMIIMWLFFLFFGCGCACGVDNALVYLWADSVQVVTHWYLYLIHLRTIPSTYKVLLVEWTIPSICGVVIVEWTIPSTCIILLEWTMPSTCVILVEWTMPWSICGQISPICGQWRSCWNFAKLF